MSSSDSSEHTALEGSLAVVVRRSTRIVDEFEPEAQASSSHPLEYTGPLISSKLTPQQLDEIRKMYRIPMT